VEHQVEWRPEDDGHLRQIAERRPSTLAELQAVQGMGELKVDRFGEAFLSVLRDS